MPNSQSPKPLLPILAVTLVLAACALTPADPQLLAIAESAVERAEAAGAETHAATDLRRARARLEAARAELGNRRGAAARSLADEAEIDAQLALTRTRAALERIELAARRQALEQLEANLRAEFGDELDLR